MLEDVIDALVKCEDGLVRLIEGCCIGDLLGARRTGFHNAKLASIGVCAPVAQRIAVVQGNEELDVCSFHMGQSGLQGEKQHGSMGHLFLCIRP